MNELKQLLNQLDTNNIYNNSRENVIKLQQILGVKDDGYMGQKTIKALQSALGTTVDGKWGSGSRQAVANYNPVIEQPQQIEDKPGFFSVLGNGIKNAFLSGNIATGNPSETGVTGVQYKEKPVSNKKPTLVSKVNPEQTIPGNSTNASAQAATKQLENKASKKAKLVAKSIVEPKQTANVPIMSRAEYIYRSGNQGFVRRLGNLISVAGNLVNGMAKRDGVVSSWLSDGGKRQLVGAAMHKTGNKEADKSQVSELDHQQLGGLGEYAHSGEEFRDTSAGLGKLIKQAMDSPYHNIYGSSTTVTTDNGKSYGVNQGADSYDFQNIWLNGEPKEVTPGTLGFLPSVLMGYTAYKNGASGKGAIETMATMRGVNVKPGKGASVSEEELAKYNQEYDNYKALSNEERARINKQFGFSH